MKVFHHLQRFLVVQRIIRDIIEHIGDFRRIEQLQNTKKRKRKKKRVNKAKMK
jgi:hypothetical protein